ncbi:uncharacterized protein LOC122874540 [Siniperca chuatsi]|uniref:uncharacterized protein LOC122874540 n=1 Tax=Siniperca chuatsi TaxID=119488 RepID=UPI001CE0A097|nr:uncharacterized protein LOC122874540 [Siniperca chuatsi]
MCLLISNGYCGSKSINPSLQASSKDCKFGERWWKYVHILWQSGVDESCGWRSQEVTCCTHQPTHSPSREERLSIELQELQPYREGLSCAGDHSSCRCLDSCLPATFTSPVFNSSTLPVYHHSTSEPEPQHLTSSVILVPLTVSLHTPQSALHHGQPDPRGTTSTCFTDQPVCPDPCAVRPSQQGDRCSRLRVGTTANLPGLPSSTPKASLWTTTPLPTIPVNV